MKKVIVLLKLLIVFHSESTLSDIKIPCLDWLMRGITSSPNDCDHIILEAEKKFGIPHGLLMAIAIAESGIKKSCLEKKKAWPWTINANGKSYYLNSKKEAIAKLKELKNAGIKNIDVGCMQINLFHHLRAFNSPEEALTPKNNIEYAANFLKDLFNKFKSWEKAVCYYHSKNERFYTKYRSNVMNIYASTSKTGMNPTKLRLYAERDNHIKDHYSRIDKEISQKLHALGRMSLARNEPKFTMLYQ